MTSIVRRDRMRFATPWIRVDASAPPPNPTRGGRAGASGLTALHRQLGQAWRGRMTAVEDFHDGNRYGTVLGIYLNVAARRS